LITFSSRDHLHIARCAHIHLVARQLPKAKLRAYPVLRVMKTGPDWAFTPRN